MIKLISLDLWDTLISDKGSLEEERDLERTRFIIETLNIPQDKADQIMAFFRELVHSFKNPSKENSWAIMPETQLQRLFEKINVKPTEEQFEKILKVYIEEALYKMPVFTEDDIIETLKKLKSHYKLALISNTGRTPGKVLDKILERMGILCFFDVLTFSDEVRERKPDKKIFEITAERACVKLEEAVHIGDSGKIDFLGAKNAGMKALLYVPPTRTPSLDTPFYIRSLKEIEEAIRKFYDKT